jgi:hypothetical protein
MIASIIFPITLLPEAIDFQQLCRHLCNLVQQLLLIIHSVQVNIMLLQVQTPVRYFLKPNYNAKFVFINCLCDAPCMHHCVFILLNNCLRVVYSI